MVEILDFAPDENSLLSVFIHLPLLWNTTNHNQQIIYPEFTVF